MSMFKHRRPAAGSALVSAPVLALVLAQVLVLSACATVSSGSTSAGAAPTAKSDPAAKPATATPVAAPASAVAPSAAAGTTPTRPPAAGSPPAFAEVIKDATEAKGYIPVWTKDEKTWLELRPEHFDRPLFFGNSTASGLGERMFLPGLMGREQLVKFKRVGNTVQLIAINTTIRAPSGTPLERAVQESYSDSLLASAPAASAAQPERKSILVDAAALLLGDLLGVQTQLEANYRLAYALDRGNSAIERTRTSDQGTFITVRSHYSVPKLPAPPAMAPGAPPSNPAAMPNPPRSVPDPRSLFLSFTYTLAPLPQEPMVPRLADQRVGYFTDAYLDFGNSANGDRRTHVITRWRLDKKEPAAAVSEPKEPIRVVMDKNIPEKWREPIRAGILEWNLAFERAGIRNALALEQQPADADWSSLEGTRVLAVRWFALDGPGAVAVGPSQTDPRTGEILRGAAIIPENWVLLGRTRVAEQLPRLPGEPTLPAWALGRDDRTCTYMLDALEQAEFGYALLAARGTLDPNSPEAERFIAASLKDVTMHEVGHALGLRHNFKASIGIAPTELRDPGFVARHGISNSVMDYNALNLPLTGEQATEFNQTTLGRYDYWAIEYGYTPLPYESERAILDKLAARSATDPTLVYATDEDAGGFFGQGIDPTANLFDLGNDPLGYADRQFKLVRELWTRTERWQLAPDDTLAVNRRNLQRGMLLFGQSVGFIAKYVGGVYTSRDTAGTGRPLFTPVPADTQKRALELLTTQVFAAESFRFDPKFLSRLGYDQLDRIRGPVVTNTDFSLATVVLDIQRRALDALMSDGVALRLADAETKTADRRQLLSYADLQLQLSTAVWSELAAGSPVDSLRRNLQREHAKRIAAGLLRPTSGAAADVRAAHRQVAVKLEADLKRALGSSKLDAMTRAHLADTRQMLGEALRAPLIKQGV
jgi:hypothetical protein